MTQVALKARVLDGAVVGIEEFVDNREERLVVRGCIKTKYVVVVMTKRLGCCTEAADVSGLRTS